jgi:hypothetical protein
VDPSGVEEKSPDTLSHAIALRQYVAEVPANKDEEAPANHKEEKMRPKDSTVMEQ